MNYFDFENGIDYYQASKALVDNKQLIHKGFNATYYIKLMNYSNKKYIVDLTIKLNESNFILDASTNIAKEKLFGEGSIRRFEYLIKRLVHKAIHNLHANLMVDIASRTTEENIIVEDAKEHANANKTINK